MLIKYEVNVLNDLWSCVASLCNYEFMQYEELCDWICEKVPFYMLTNKIS